MWVSGMQPPWCEGDVGLRHVYATLSLSPDGTGAPKDGDTLFLALERGLRVWGSAGESLGGLCGAHRTILGILAPTSQLAPDGAVF